MSETPPHQHWYSAELVRVPLFFTGYFSVWSVPSAPASDHFFVSHIIIQIFLVAQEKVEYTGVVARKEGKTFSPQPYAEI